MPPLTASTARLPTPPLADPARITDPFRLDALGRTGLLDGAASDVLDRVAQLTAAALGAPFALVSLVDDRRQHFPGFAGLPEWAAAARGTPLSHSICQHVVAAEAPLVVDDAAQHPLVRDNLACRDLGVAAYAGVPLTSADGDTLGALCALDLAPRQWTPGQVDVLRGLAALAMSEIELRRTVRALRDSEARLAASDARLTRALAAASMGTWEWDLVAGRTEFSPEWGPIFGLAPGDGVPALADFFALVHPEDRLGVRAAIDDALAGRDAYDVRYRVRTPSGETRLLHDLGTVRHDEHGRAVEIAGVVRDVTPADRRAEAAARGRL